MPAVSSTQKPGPRRRRTRLALASAAALLLLLIPSLLLGRLASQTPQAARGEPPYTSYRDIPGVTGAEIAAIEALRGKYRNSALVYGMVESIEAFYGPAGQAQGFAALVSECMSKLFGIKVNLTLFEWGDLIAGLESGKVDFTGELTPTEKRRDTYHMTGVIATRSIIYFQKEGAETPAKIAAKRPLRYGFLEGTSTAEAVIAASPDSVEAFYFTEYADAYRMLMDERMDAFFEESPSKGLFDDVGGTVNAVFLPLIYEPVALSTQRMELTPIISVMEKFLQNGGLSYFIHLYDIGRREYMASRMFAALTGEEKAYVSAKPVVKIGAEYDNYPFSFYNTNEKEWQGMSLDVLREIESLTGITFRIANDERADFSSLVENLENGKISLVTELIRSSEREGRFLWPDVPIMENRNALISKVSHRNVGINDVLNLRVGIQTGTAHADLFRKWFPGHAHTIEYKSANAQFDALERDDIDLVMSTQMQILAVTNYMERPGYKINVLFDHWFESTFGLNINEPVLCSVIEKALRQIDLDAVSEGWLHKTYDYRLKMVQSRQPLFMTLSILLLCVAALLYTLFRKTRGMEKQLQTLVNERTAKLDGQIKLLEAVTKNYKGVIWSIDRDGIITMFNGQYLKTIGVEPSFLEGKNIDLARMKNRHLDIISNVQKTLVEGPQNWMSVIDGGTFHSNTMPIYDVNGNIVGVTGTTDDITDMVRMSQDLEAALEAAKSASRAKSAFLANMSHEIRTPMNSVIGFSELALDYEMPPEAREHIGKILENSKWLLQIINDILDVSKIEAGKMTLENIPFDLHEIFVLCRTATIPKALERGLLLHFYAEPFVGKRLIGDPTRLRQVFINLISNAVKFTNVGTVKVSATLNSMTDDTVAVHFEVRDSGIGMTVEEMKKVLEPFAQADYSTTRKYGGTGLGLSIIKSIVELMGGKLTVESTPGIGSKFSFDLTFKTVDVPVDAGSLAELDGEDVDKPMFAGGEILVCEDNAMNQEVIRRHLDRVGLKAVIAENGKVGVDAVKSRRDRGEKMFDMIFMDINMPVMDGLEASGKIMEMNTGIPVVAMTANVMSSDRELYEKNGMHDCVGKPFTSQELWRCLLRYIKPVKTGFGDGEREIKIEKAGPEPPLYDDDLLLEMKTMFVNDNQSKFGDFMAAVNGGDFKLAHRIAHTLKSNAGMIGRTALQTAAAEAERLLAGGENRLTEELIDTIEKEMAAALLEFEPLRKKDDGASGDPAAADTTADLSFMDELDGLLRKGNPDSLKFTASLRAVKGSEELIRQIEDFDFDEAVETLAALRKNMEAANG